MSNIFINQIAPLLGVLLSTIQYSSSIFTFIECRKKQELNNINPIPITVNFINCIAWVIYGCILKNPYLIGSVTGGCFSSLFSIITSLYILGKNGDIKTMEIMEKILLLGLLMWIIIAYILSTIATERSAVTIIGFISCIVTILYYYSPLSTIQTIIKTKDSSSLHFPMLVMNFIGSSIWTIYGIFGIYDPFLYIPCGIGVFFTTILLIARFVYGSKLSNPYETHENIEINSLSIKSTSNNNQNIWSNSPLHLDNNDNNNNMMMNYNINNNNNNKTNNISNSSHQKLSGNDDGDGLEFDEDDNNNHGI